MTTQTAEMSDIKRELYGEPDYDRMTDAQAAAETRAEIARLKAGGESDSPFWTREELIEQLERYLPENQKSC